MEKHGLLGISITGLGFIVLLLTLLSRGDLRQVIAVDDCRFVIFRLPCRRLTMPGGFNKSFINKFSEAKKNN
jgi:hypothetical protein